MTAPTPPAAEGRLTVMRNPRHPGQVVGASVYLPADLARHPGFPLAAGRVRITVVRGKLVVEAAGEDGR